MHQKPTLCRVRAYRGSGLPSPTGEPLEKFVELVQVADPSALTKVLDDDVVDFLRRFLRSG